MKKDRIAMVVFSHYPSDPRVRREAEALIEAGMSVDVISLRDVGEPPKERINGVKVYRIKIKRKRGSALRYLWEYGCFIVLSFVYLSIRHLIRHYKVVHSHNMPDILVFSTLCPKMSGSKIILDIHDVMPEVYMRKYGIPESHKIIKALKYLEKVSAKFSDHVITASPFFRQTLIRRSLSPGKCTTIMNLPDSKYFNGTIQPIHSHDNKFKIIYPGSLGEIHGVDIAIKAIERVVKETNIPIEFHIYGGANSERNKLINLTKKLNLESFIFFHSKVSSEELSIIYNSMDVGLIPKRDGIHAQDAMSTKLFEYAAVGLPAIVSRTKSDSLYFNDKMVLFFEPENEKNLADCILKLYQNPQLRQFFSQQMKLLDKKVNWEAEKKRLFAVYGRLYSPS